MKYFPLIWAALWRRPIRTILAFISAVVAFTLFGLTVGMNAGLAHLAAVARADRLYVNARYSGSLTLAQGARLGRVAGVTHVGFFGGLVGYHQMPANSIAVMMVDPQMRDVFPELQISPSLWQALERTRNGVIFSRAMAVRYPVRAGDDFPLLTPGPSRDDGSHLWNFKIVGVVDDIAFFPVGFAIGNYDFLDRARPFGERGDVAQYWLLIRDGRRAEETAEAIDGMFTNSPVPTRSESEKAIMEAIGGAGNDTALAIDGIAGLGMFMIVFLTGNALAQSVRERLTEFAVLKTLGFSSRGVVALVFAEAAVPCLLGAGCGLALAKGTAVLLPHVLPPGVEFPMPAVSLPVAAVALLAALLVAFCSAALPASRVARLDVATIFARH